MGFLDKLLGREEEQPVRQAGGGYMGASGQGKMSEDEIALARYRYMLQTAPPDQIEAAHAEAFERLTPQQRQMALQQLSTALPDNERQGLSDDPCSLARAATRAEMRQPGTMERTFGGGGMGGGMMGGGMGMGLGGMMAGSLMMSIAGGFIGSAIAGSFFNNPAVASDFAQSNPDAGGDLGNINDPQTVGDFGGDNAGDDFSQDFGGGDDSGGDFGGGDFGGDF